MVSCFFCCLISRATRRYCASLTRSACTDLNMTLSSFLKEIDRIAKPDYMPSDNDIVRARLRTVGVQEHHLVLETGGFAAEYMRLRRRSLNRALESCRSRSRIGVDDLRRWRFSIHGMYMHSPYAFDFFHLVITPFHLTPRRLQRAQWPSYFDTVNAIIFLAPIACFDEHLLENPTINRLDDTLQLWKIVCENKLLQNTELVLFLNKCDLLRRKLERGVRFGEWVTSYDSGKEKRENDATAVGRCEWFIYYYICCAALGKHGGLMLTAWFQISRLSSPTSSDSSPRRNEDFTCISLLSSSVIPSIRSSCPLQTNLVSSYKDTKATAITLGAGSFPINSCTF